MCNGITSVSDKKLGPYPQHGWHFQEEILGAPRCGSGPNWCLEGPPPSPLQLEDPSLKPKPFPPRPLPPSSPHPPWLFLQHSGSPGRGGPVWCGGRGPRGVEGEGPPAILGARPTSGGTRKFRKDPGNALRAFPGIPLESTAGIPQPCNSMHLRLPERFQNSLPPHYGWGRLFFQKWFRRGPLRAGHGISENCSRCDLEDFTLLSLRDTKFGN